MDSPTPEEIAERCLEIQATWDEDTRRSRIADPSRRPDYVYHWTVPVVSIEELGGEAESALQSVVDIGDIMENAEPLIPYPIPVFPVEEAYFKIGTNQDRVRTL
jgi:hypothetical protein